MLPVEEVAAGTTVTTPATTSAVPPAQAVEFTPAQQAVIDRLMGERATRAEASAVKAMLESLGVKSADEVKAALKKAKDIEDAQLTETQRAQAKAADLERQIAEANQQREAALAEAKATLIEAAVMAEASKAAYRLRDGVMSDLLLVIKSDPALIGKLTVEGGKVAGAKEVVEAVLKTRDYLQAPSVGGGQGTPRPGAKRTPGGKEATEQERAQAARNYQSKF